MSWMRKAVTLPLCLAAAWLGALGLASVGTIVVVNQGAGFGAISKDALEAVFTGKTQSLPDGTPAVVATLKGGPAHEAFLKGHLNKNPQQFLSAWRNLAFTGKGKMPQQFESEEDLVAFVAKTKGAIGYIDDGTPHPGVKVVKVQ